ncbi:MAG: EAL domain-containing protein [Thioalkalispiraceae bacterium]|jgi:diguanylate cyclase (GGDEF)-like protein
MPNPNTSIVNWFKFSSLKQRYLTTAFFLSLILLLASYFGWDYVEGVSQQQLQSVELRSEAEDALGDLITQIHTIETDLQRFITFPGNKNKLQVLRSFELFESSIDRLSNNQWLNSDPALSDLLSSIYMDKIKLSTHVDNLIKVRLDESQWFPAMHIMKERMLVKNADFLSALELIMLNYNDEITNKNNAHIYKLLINARHAWVAMISEFRLFVANSFGVFSSPAGSGMQNRKHNVDLYLEHVEELLGSLEELAEERRLTKIDAQSLKLMRKSFDNWRLGYEQVHTELLGEYSRRDLLLLNNVVEPVINRLKQRSSNLKFELGVASAKNITELTLLARNLSNFVIVLAIILTLIGLIGYVVFHSAILRPISDFASALKAEANNQDIAPSRFVVSQAAEFKNLIAAFHDMREQVKIRQSHLDHMAHHDSLTSLPNRSLLRDRLELAIARSRRDKSMVALMFLDLDRFKQINDSLGHDIGDELLSLVAKRLVECTRSTDTVSRLGGDEFAIMLEGINHADQAASLARKILKSFERPFQVAMHELHSTTSIGIALGPNDDADVDALVKDADIAMYHAKELGRNNFKFYSAEMAAEVAEHMVLENQLRHALDEDGFFLLYQPIVEISSGEIVGTEALLRWQHPQRGILSPEQFLTILEDSGLIKPVTQWVLQEASNQYKRFQQAGYPEVRMSINLSAVLLRNDSIFDLVINVIEQTHIDPTGLVVEITEDTLLEDLQVSEKALATLKSMGIRIALDDFGTGQSSLSHLRLEPIDIVKIDREFIRTIPENKSDSDLVDAVIAMAHKLHMKVVAEGVENEQQLEFLRWHKCDAIQGYYYSKPCSGEQVLSLLTNNTKSISSN